MVTGIDLIYNKRSIAFFLCKMGKVTILPRPVIQPIFETKPFACRLFVGYYPEKVDQCPLLSGDATAAKCRSAYLG